MCLAQGHNTVTPVWLGPLAPQSQVKHSTTEPLCSCLVVIVVLLYIFSGSSLINFTCEGESGRGGGRAMILTSSGSIWSSRRVVVMLVVIYILWLITDKLYPLG